MSFHVRLPRNEKGRDFVVGDIHGEADKLLKALASVRFDFDEDRLIAVGDLIDRGPRSLDMLKMFAGGVNFYSVRGNHEQMAIDSYISSNPNVTGHHIMNGGAWFHALGSIDQAKAAQIMTDMPLAITVETSYGDVGIVHAQPDESMTWSEFIDALNDPHIQNIALWSRGIISRNRKVNIEGVKHVYCGHTPVSEPLTLGNVTFIDSGACFGSKPLFIVQVSP